MSEVIKTFTGSGSINFEEDQREDLNSVNDAKSLSDQVIKLKELEDDLETKEKELKELKRHIELVSGEVDRKSTRLNSSHGYISYAVFCLKKKKTQYNIT